MLLLSVNQIVLASVPLSLATNKVKMKTVRSSAVTLIKLFIYFSQGTSITRLQIQSHIITKLQIRPSIIIHSW